MNLYCKIEKCIYFYPNWEGTIILVQPGVGKGAEKIFFHQNKPLLSAIRDCHHLLKLPTKIPTPCKELVTGWPNYIGVKYASSHVIGDIITGKEKECTPMVFCLAWPDDVKELFRKGKITNLDLEGNCISSTVISAILLIF